MIDRFNKLLASYSVTRTLYDSKNGIYDILQQYIAYVISDTHQYSFSLTWITDRINEVGGFELKEPVVKTCLKQMKIDHQGITYTCMPAQIKVDESWKQAFEEAEKDNKYLYDSLMAFLRDRKQEKTEAHDEEFYVRALCDYLIDGVVPANDTLTTYISEYVVEKENDTKICSILSHLKEGTVIHEGIRYCDNCSEIHSAWNDILTLYLDTEVLFAIGGYNSNMLQVYCSDFLSYVKELNRAAKNGSHIILRYFNETYNELNSFFDAANRIVRQLDDPDPSREAILQIINGCATPSDIEQKRSRFFNKLSDLGIERDNTDFYDTSKDDNKKYCYEDEGIISRYTNEWKYSENDIYRSLAVLSHINILRKGRSNTTFERCEYIFLTATNRTKRLAFAQEIYKEKEIPLATTLDFIISRFWLRLRKGFGESRKPRTLDMVMRARTLLSTILSDKVYVNYQKLRVSYEEGEMTKEEFAIANRELKERLKKPDEIRIQDYDDDIEEIGKWDFKDVLQNYEYDKQRLAEAEKIISNVKDEMQIKERQSKEEQIELCNKYLDIINKKEKEAYEKDEQIAKKEQRIKELEEAEKNRIENEEKKKKRRNKAIAIVLIVVIIAIFILTGIYSVVGTFCNWRYASTVSAALTYFGVVALVMAIIRYIWGKMTKVKDDAE